MKLTGTLAKLGTAFQLAYMEADFDEALSRWNALGVGPFYRMGLIFDDIEFQGRMTELDIDIAFSHWGDIQIEIIRQNNDDQPSIYLDWQTSKNRAIHHIGVMVDDIAAARAQLEATGYEIVFHKKMQGQGEFMYGKSPHAPGLIELAKLAPPATAAMARLRSECAKWDGTRPLREFSELVG